jgi:hypothetical protein
MILLSRYFQVLGTIVTPETLNGQNQSENPGLQMLIMCLEGPNLVGVGR